jgi:Flp pilus assembly protein CpaB
LPIVIGVLLVVVAFAGIVVVGRLTTGGVLNTKVAIIAAKHDIRTGSVVQSGDLTTTDVDVAPTGAIKDPALAVGKVARHDFHQGDPVLDADLATPAIQGATKLFFVPPAGMVAINIPASDISPYVQPGDEIDVIAAPRGGSSCQPGSCEFKTTLKGLKVISIGTPGTPTAGNLVVAVNLQDAEALQFIVKNTDFTYVLKSLLDRDKQDPATTGVDLPTFKARFGFR